jgi:hypothetical protein
LLNNRILHLGLQGIDTLLFGELPVPRQRRLTAALHLHLSPLLGHH